MRIFDKLTGGGVVWQIELDNASGAFQPEAIVSGRVRFTPEHQIDVRATKVALVGSEHFVYSVRRASSGSNRGSTRQNQWFDEELFRQQLDLTGAASFAAGASTEFPFQFQLPQGALPSFESNVLRMRWYVRAWMDVGGNDPDAERELNVTPPPGTLQASGEALAAISGDGTVWIAAEPAPIVAGQPFRGHVLSPEPLNLSSSRIEVKQKVQTHEGGGAPGGQITVGNVGVALGGGRMPVSEERVLWSAQLTSAGVAEGGHRYEFAGQFPVGPFGSIALPHGSSSASLDLVISRRLMPDRHVARPVAIATG